MLFKKQYIPPIDINEIKDFFKNEEDIELLNNNNFDKILDKFKIYSTDYLAYNTMIKFLDRCNIDYINYLTALPPSAFRDCKFLQKELRLPSNIKTIGKKVFYNCVDLDTLYIPSTVDTYDINAFKYAGMKKIVFENSAADLLNKIILSSRHDIELAIRDLLDINNDIELIFGE